MSTKPTETAAIFSLIKGLSTTRKFNHFFCAMTNARNAPVIAAVLVPPSACNTSQSTVIVFSPKRDRSTTERKHRPIKRAISTDLPSLRAKVLSR